jgi:hypothetical protein
MVRRRFNKLAVIFQRKFPTVPAKRIGTKRHQEKQQQGEEHK